MYIDAFLSLMLVIGAIIGIFAGLRLLGGKGIVWQQKAPAPPVTPPMEISGFKEQHIDGEYKAVFLEFKGMRYVVLKDSQSMVLLETIRMTTPSSGI